MHTYRHYLFLCRCYAWQGISREETEMAKLSLCTSHWCGSTWIWRMRRTWKSVSWKQGAATTLQVSFSTQAKRVPKWTAATASTAGRYLWYQRATLPQTWGIDLHGVRRCIVCTFLLTRDVLLNSNRLFCSAVFKPRKYTVCLYHESLLCITFL